MFSACGAQSLNLTYPSKQRAAESAATGLTETMPREGKRDITVHILDARTEKARLTDEDIGIYLGAN
jgi:hypothetical protein